MIKLGFQSKGVALYVLTPAANVTDCLHGEHGWPRLSYGRLTGVFLIVRDKPLFTVAVRADLDMGVGCAYSEVRIPVIMGGKWNFRQKFACKSHITVSCF